MKLKFLAKGVAPINYDISGAFINGVDTSLFTNGSMFVGNETTQSAGIYDLQWVDGELYVTLGQMTKAYQLTVTSHDWAEGEWINTANYDPAMCYVVATRPKAKALLKSGHAEYFCDTDGRWSVRMIKAMEQEPVT